MPKNESHTVWSSDQGDLCKQQAPSRAVKSLLPSQQTVYLHRDAKGRRGKTVTVVKKLVLSEADMIDLAKELKRACGSGGTMNEDSIEIQGEHREKVADLLVKMGYKVKIAGG